MHKIFLETQRARVTLLLAQHHESLASTGAATSPEAREAFITASDLLSDLQVETYSSMERREKTEFILEQMRLLIAVARLKDAESGKDGKDAMGGGEGEWVKVRVGSRKVNEEFLKEKENEVCSSLSLSYLVHAELFVGSQTQILRHDGPTWSPPHCLPRRRQVLLQGLGDTNNQRGC